MPITHTVQQGEDLFSISNQYGIHDPMLIWNYEKNSSLRESRAGPGILFPGDLIHVPEKLSKGISIAIDQKHILQVKRPRRHLAIKFLGIDATILPSIIVLNGRGGARFTGTIRPDGVVTAEIEAEAGEYSLELMGNQFSLILAGMNPIVKVGDDGVSGIQMRLYNLGYLKEAPTGEMDKYTRIAIALFQIDMGLSVNGNITEEFMESIVEESGC